MRTSVDFSNDRMAERGFALPATILALVVIGGLVTGAFYAASQENRAGTSSRMTTEAFYLAERGLEEVLGTWNAAAFVNVATGTTTPAVTVNVTNGAGPIGRYTTRVRKLSDRLSLIQSTGEVLNRGRYASRRDLAMMVRLLDFDVPTGAAMYVYGDLRVTGTAQVTGEDADPWPGICSPTGDVSAAVLRDTTAVTTSGACNQAGDCLEGDDPLLQQDEGMTQSGLMDFGDLDYDGLASLADKVITATNPGQTQVTTINGVCKVSDLMNWGEISNPTHPCFDYFPIIHLKGSPTTTFNLSQSNGQGILLVDGNLKVQGNFVFHGIILVKGKLESAGTGNHLNGVVIVAGGSELGSNQATGNSIIQFSSCSIARAQQNSMRPAAIAERAWADLSGVGATL